MVKLRFRKSSSVAPYWQEGGGGQGVGMIPVDEENDDEEDEYPVEEEEEELLLLEEELLEEEDDDMAMPLELRVESSLDELVGQSVTLENRMSSQPTGQVLCVAELAVAVVFITQEMLPGGPLESWQNQ